VVKNVEERLRVLSAISQRVAAETEVLAAADRERVGKSQILPHSMLPQTQFSVRTPNKQ
jgi:hypothetical protein